MFRGSSTMQICECEVHHTTCMIYRMGYRTPDPGNPRVQFTRDRILAAARELLAETGPAGLTYSLLAERAGVTRQTLYRHWPTRSGLLVDLILEGGSADGYPEPGDDPAAVAAAWLASLRDGPRSSPWPRRPTPTQTARRLSPSSPPTGSPRSTTCSSRQASRSPRTSTRCFTGRCSPGSSSSATRPTTASSPPSSPSGSPAGGSDRQPSPQAAFPQTGYFSWPR